MKISVSIQSIKNELEKDFINSLKGGEQTIPVRVAKEIENEISRVAGRKLTTTFQRFMSDISIKVSKNRVDIELGEFAKGIESGFPQRNLRSLLNGPSVKFTKLGKRYIDIPFKQATPNAKMQGGEDYAGKLSRDAYEAVKVAGELMYSPNHRDIKTNSFGYTHQNHIYHNLRKYTSTQPGQTRYISFRRISENSDASAFKIKATSGFNVIKESLTSFDPSNISRVKIKN